MPREKKGYRDTLANLNEMFPSQGVLNKSETAVFLGVSQKTIYRYVQDGKIRFNGLGRITKADLAMQVCLGNPD